MAEKRANKRYQLTDGPIASTLISMTIPMILGMLMMFSFNLVDTFFISMLGTEALSAISFTFPVTFTIMSLAIGLSIGTSAVVAKYIGRGETEKAKEASTVTNYVAMALAGVLALIGYLLMDQIFLLLGASASMLPAIRDYMDIWLPTSILLVALICANSVLRANGDTRTPSIVMASAGLINAVLDPLLIFGWGPIPAMGIQGAALATLFSWVGACIFLFYFLAIRHELIHKGLPSMQVFRTSAREMLRIGIPASGANMMTPIAAGVMTAIIAGYGDTAVAAFGVGSRLESMACMVILALSSTLPPFVSQNLGAGKLERIEEACRLSLRFVLGWQLMVYLLMAAGASLIAWVFTRDEEVAGIIRLYIWIMPLSYGMQGVIILCNSALNAIHRPMVALYLSMARFFVFYVPLAWIGSMLFGLPGFFGGAVVGNILMAALSWLTFRRVMDRERAQLDVVGAV
ncbi:MATE family efflux transporter [Pseudohongiella sp.]|uniref:MATE family efflux transporter n=1 Tax=marine sediment metagenome TaxID=412755 RepID=A0A0F9W2M5_9ZZZZ|nr:MATE family efflux transporter [Pseudohongiella sp.]HDZ09238.1 MATE family efflux transporter [Pseudohongiella sp.]HEA62102.1 MATE family efflux transporter [Pseudohongiella sp.]